MPYTPSKKEDAPKHGFETFTGNMALVKDYSGLDFDRIGEMDYIEYRILLKDAFIHNLEQTEDGRKYLEAAWIRIQTEPDREQLRRLFGRSAR